MSDSQGPNDQPENQLPSEENQNGSENTPQFTKRRKLMLGVAFAIGVWFILRGVFGLIVPPVAEHPIQSRRLTVVAHRGGANEYPENTMLAFRQAVAAGVDVLELDVHLSSDGELVIIHDDDLYRTTSAEGPVSSFTLSELQSFDAGYWFPGGRKPDCEACLQIPDDDFPFRGQSVRIPALQELLEEFPDFPMVIEMKPEDPAIVTALGDMLSSYGLEDSVVVASFHSSLLGEFRERYPDFATTAGQAEVIQFFVMNLLGFGTSYPSQAEFFNVPVSQGPLTVITRGFLSSSAENNIQVHAWTINDRAEMERLLDMGVDGIITDEPSLLLNILGR